MRRIFFYLLLVSIVVFAACNTNKNKEQSTAPFLTAKEVVRLNQLIYKDSLTEAFVKNAPAYKVVFLPKAIDGNYAIIAKNKTAEQYALVIRGSVIEFSNEGFQNFILQDFNIFTIKKWDYADTVKEAYISQGTYIGFKNLLQLKDIATGLTIKEFIEQKIPAGASLVITGHSLGGNLAYPLAGYLKKELPTGKKENLQLITFGATAAGNAAFVQDLEDKFPDGERYATTNDIAPIFPDLENISELAKKIGLDSVLQLGKLNINGLNTKIDAGTLLNIAGEILEKTNVINKTNKYVQSQKHLRLLTVTDTIVLNKALTAEAIFGNAYRYHRVDAYAELLGGEALK
jgi:Lipase (class 3)